MTAFDIFIKNKKDKVDYQKLNILEKHKIVGKENPGYLVLGIVFTGISILFGVGIIAVKMSDINHKEKNKQFYKNNKYDSNPNTLSKQYNLSK